jgi:hypothetical protein
VGRLEPGGDLDFTEEADGADEGGDLRAEHLYRDLAPVPEILGEIDSRRAS